MRSASRSKMLRYALVVGVLLSASLVLGVTVEGPNLISPAGTKHCFDSACSTFIRGDGGLSLDIQGLTTAINTVEKRDAGTTFAHNFETYAQIDGGSAQALYSARHFLRMGAPGVTVPYSSTATGLLIDVATQTSAASASAFGISSVARSYGPGNTSTLSAASLNTYNQGGTVASATGYSAFTACYSDDGIAPAVITDNYGVRVLRPFLAGFGGPDLPGTITNNYGVYVAQQERGGTSDFAFLYDHPTVPVAITGPGSLGIGTKTPNAKLTVIGDGYIDGGLRVTGQVYADGGILFGDGTSQVTAVTDAAPVAGEFLPDPEGSRSGNATRIAQTNFDGASYTVHKKITINRLVFRATGQSGAPTARILIYQTANGGSGVASLKATVSAFAIPTAPTTYEAPFAEGSVTLQTGLIFVLWGRDSGAGSWTARTFTTSTTDLLTQVINLNTHPVSFTTAIAANTTPATFDAREAPTGQATGTNSDVIMVLRFINI